MTPQNDSPNTSQIEYELPLLDFGLSVDCPYCVNSSGHMVTGYWYYEGREEWDFAMCDKCGGSGKFEVMRSLADEQE